MMRFLRTLGILAVLITAGTAAHAQPVQSFDAFIADFESQAVAAGIDRGLYRSIMAGMTPDPRTPDLIAGQPEFTTPIWEYLDQRVSAARVAQGREAFARNRRVFEAVGKRFGVDPYLLAAIWGIETNYGTILSNDRYIRPIVRSLATVVHQRRARLAQDEQELIAALKLIQNHGWTNDSLVGSWAGAIGHTQVIASGLLKYGTDGDGDGGINPHTSLADALATTANYFRALGYQPGHDWGYEVNLPEGFDYMLASREDFHPVSFFAKRGVTRVAGREFSAADEQVFLYVPAGQNGPKFLMTANYLAIKGYNFSDSYALAVAHLTDRLKGAGPFEQSWPRNARFPNLKERIAIQKRLKQLGYYSGAVDGRIGPVSQRAYQSFQKAKGLPADGFITRDAYERLEKAN